VTPAFKFGEPPAPGGVSADGRVYFTDIGAFGEPGDNGAIEGSGYFASRAAGGWVSEPIDLSATEFQRSGFGGGPPVEDVSGDLSGALSQHAPVGAKRIDGRFYIRREGGAFVEVGPTVPPAAVAAWTEHSAELGEKPFVVYAGASRDLSHVLFMSKRLTNSTDFLWPGDATVSFESLYEYVGTGHGGGVPALVGVSDGSTVVKGVRLPAGALISECGTVLGGLPSNGDEEPVDLYNAVSEAGAGGEAGALAEEGARVFFTAKEGGCPGLNRAGEVVVGEGPNIAELYARVNGAHTVAISEPTKADCAACDTSEAAAPGAGALRPTFVGASRTGSRVFFTTTQKLLPPAGSGVNLYMYDFGGAPGARVTLLGSALAGAGALAGGVMRVSEDGSRVYFVSTGVLAGNLDAKSEPAVAGEDNLYVVDTATGATRFIAALSPADAQKDWLSLDTGREAVATADGGVFVFASVNDLTPDARGASEQLYRYDANSGALERITLGEAAINENGNAQALATRLVAPDYGARGYAKPEASSLSGDGSQVVFESSLALTAGALNNVCAFSEEGNCIPALNVYEFEGGRVYLVSDGKDAHGVITSSATGLIGLTPSGRDLFFTTADPLVSGDTDSQLDIYDARVDGGIPESLGAGGCGGEGCQGALSAAPSFTAPASTVSGGGQALPPEPAPTAAAGGSRKQGTGKLAAALRVCRARDKHHKRARARCEAKARKRFGSSPAKKANSPAKGR
jgi:hypothetical protein